MTIDKAPAKKPANRRIIFTMGGKGGAGKTTVLAAIVSYLQEQKVSFDLFDADIENDKRGNLKLYFPEAEKVNISTERGLDLFVDRLFAGSKALAIADLGAGAGADTFPWFDKMHGLLAKEGMLFTAVGVFVRDPASVETIFSWASRLRDRVSYLIVKNERDSDSFPYFDDTPEGAKFKELAQPTIIRFERRESDIQHELNARGLTLEQAVMALDDKGLFYRILVKMFRHFHRESQLRLIQVRPDEAGADWRPGDTWNPLDDRTMPYSAHAKIICDVAASFSSNSHPFFSQMAQIAMEYAMRGLDVADHYVTLTQVYNVTTNDDDLKALLADIAKIEGPKAAEAAIVDEYFTTRFLTLPPDTLGGLRGEMVRYLKFFTDERLSEIFSPKRGTVRLDDMDQSQVICISIPQKYATERHYINTLAKFYFYLHALRRFDTHEHDMSKSNLLVLVSDENQNIVTASEEGMSDYKIVDRIREAGATIIAATQSPTSYFPAFKAKDKAMTYMNNLRNRVICTAADKEGAEISSNLLPPTHAWERTFTSGRGGTGSSRKRVWKPPFEWGQLIRLRKFECIVQHCERGFKRATLRPINERGTVPDWYKGNPQQVERERTSLRAENAIGSR